MIMFKKIVTLLLAVIMAVSVSACGTDTKNVSQQQGLFSYTETEIGSNSGLIWPGGSRVNSQNQLVVFDRGDGTNSGFITLDQDGNPAGKLQYSFFGNVRAFTLDEQDNIYAVIAETRGDNNAQKLEVVSPTGDTLKTVDLGTFSGSKSNGMISMGFTDIAVDPSGFIYLSDPAKNIQVLDREGEPVKTLGDQGYESIDIDAEGNVIAVNSLTGKRVMDKLDASTGKSIWSIDLSAQNSGGVMMVGSNKIRFSKGDESIYYLTSQEITKYDSSGKLMGTAVDFTSYTILASGYNISDLSLDAAGNIYVTTVSGSAGGVLKNTVSGANGSNTSADSNLSGNTVVNGGPGEKSASSPEKIKYELYKYSIQSGESAAQNQEVITVSVPVPTRALEIAASKFQKDNSGYRIDIQTYPGSDYETYVKNLNTQILSGKGPDIISVAGLPYENYISRNILADLSAMMAGDKSFDMNKYYTNIFDALKYNGKLYVLPTNFTFNILMANQGILDRESIIIDDSTWTWDDFHSIAEKVTQKDGSSGSRTALPSVSPSELLNLFTGGSYSNYIDADRKNAGFTSQGFMDLLNTVKAFGEGSLTDSNVKNDMTSILEAAGRGSIVFYPYTITDYSMYGFMKAAFKEQLSLYNIPSAGGSHGGTFTSNSIYAINRSSAYKAESWEFLKTLLSNDVQAQQMQGMTVQSKSEGVGGLSEVLGGFSVNKAAQQQKARQAIDASQSGNMRIMMKSGSGSIELSPAPMSQTDIDYINEFISRLNTYANVDENISNIVQDETRPFFSGDKSVQEATKLLQDRVNIYLGE